MDCFLTNYLEEKRQQYVFELGYSYLSYISRFNINMSPQIELINMLPHYFTEKNIVGASGDLYAQPTKSPNMVWFYAQGKNYKNVHPQFSSM